MFFLIFRKLKSLQNHVFDVLDTPEVSRNDLKWIWETLFFYDFLRQKSQKNADLERYFHLARNNRFEVWDLQSKLKYYQEWRKNTTSPNDYIDFSNFKFWGVEFVKMSVNWKIKTSPALTPYYSFEHVRNMLYESLKIKGKRKYKLKSESILLSALLPSYRRFLC